MDKLNIIIDKLMDHQKDKDYLEKHYEEIKKNLSYLVDRFITVIEKLKTRFNKMPDKEKDMISDTLDYIKEISDKIDDKEYVTNNLILILGKIYDILLNLDYFDIIDTVDEVEKRLEKQ